MKKLQVLDLSDTDFTTLPSSIDSLENLRTLRLDQCHKFEDIAIIGKLTKLQVFSLVGFVIQNLPDEMEQLCDAPNPGDPLTTRQPAEYSWMSGNLPDIHENRAESPLYGELYPDTSPVI